MCRVSPVDKTRYDSAFAGLGQIRHCPFQDRTVAFQTTSFQQFSKIHPVESGSTDHVLNIGAPCNPGDQPRCDQLVQFERARLILCPRSLVRTHDFKIYAGPQREKRIFRPSGLVMPSRSRSHAEKSLENVYRRIDIGSRIDKIIQHGMEWLHTAIAGSYVRTNDVIVSDPATG